MEYKKYHSIETGMAQRQRAGLITPRSLDRNGLPVSTREPRFSFNPSLHRRQGVRGTACPLHHIASVHQGTGATLKPAWRRGSARGS